jgi:hypothetical protein
MCWGTGGVAGTGFERGKRGGGGGGSGDLNRGPSWPFRTQPTADQPSHVVLQRFSHGPTDIEAEKCTGYIPFYFST